MQTGKHQAAKHKKENAAPARRQPYIIEFRIHSRRSDSIFSASSPSTKRESIFTSTLEQHFLISPRLSQQPLRKLMTIKLLRYNIGTLHRLVGQSRLLQI